MAEWFVAIAIISYSDIKQGNIPQPRRFVGATVLYGLLALVAPAITNNIAALMGVALLFGLSSAQVKVIRSTTTAAPASFTSYGGTSTANAQPNTGTGGAVPA